MVIIRGLQNLKPEHQGCAATIGNFDGMHLGHQAVFKQLIRKAQQLNLPATAITFEPQPQEFFLPKDVPPRLTKFREKLNAVLVLQLDYLLCLHFNADLASLTAGEFVQKVLVHGLGVKYLVVGDDFRFGKGREGDFDFLKQSGNQFGFQVANTCTFDFGGERVSSTRIREALQTGNTKLAEQLLGRSYGMVGRVAHGDKRGRSIGFPTANIYVHRRSTPVSGVYAVQMLGDEQDLGVSLVNGVANVGVRPTVKGTQTLLEVHLFDFDRDIYGAHVCVNFLEKIREEQRFESFETLKVQINKDAAAARAFFSSAFCP
ncbi:MAG: bifunctional riboflavin kinase/FAD synthetase [Gammaproteobacteria bacterium]|nr:bifunctional riboflavin kinase/FAD synthetase [Gammaproteobacteria bacterium]